MLTETDSPLVQHELQPTLPGPAILPPLCLTLSHSLRLVTDLPLVREALGRDLRPPRPVFGSGIVRKLLGIMTAVGSLYL